MDKNINMLSGGIWKQLILFSAPVLFGELFQQLYNTVDLIFLGNYVSSDAMAAVGATSSVIKLLVGFFMGISVGCTVVVARHYGSKNYEKLKQSVSTIVYMALILGVILSIIGVLITGPILRLLSIPEEIIPYAIIYIRIYFAGMMGLVLYNIATGVLRAVGDVRRPFYLLVLSSILNIILDAIFVIPLNWGIAGVAYATIISQAISAILSLLLLIYNKDVFGFSFKNMRMNKVIVKQVMRIGLPTGVQKTLTSLSNIFVISYISFFGADCLAGWAVYTKVNHFIIIAVQSIGAFITTFVSQNIGAKQYLRAKKGISAAFYTSIVLTVISSIIVRISNASISKLFGSSEGMLFYSKLFISELILLQIVHVPVSIYSAALRGMGRSTIATILMLTGLVGIRQLYLTIITLFVNTPAIVGLAFPVGWSAASILIYLYYLRVASKKVFINTDVD